RAGKTIEALSDSDIAKTCAGEEVDHLCFQQSAGDSTGPEVDVAQRAVGQDFSNDNVCDLQATARFEHTRDFGNGAFLFRYQIQDPVRDQDVDASILDGQRSSVSGAHFDVIETTRRSTGRGALPHPLGHVDADRMTPRTRVASRQQEVGTGTATDIENGCASR